MQVHFLAWLLLLSPVALADTNATVKQATPLLAQPVADAAELARLAAEQPVAVLERQGGWYQVAVPEQATGWLRLFQLQFVKERYQPDNVPLRELTGLMRGSHQQVTSSTGVRGLDKVAITNAKPDFEQLVLLQSFQQPAEQAQTFAKAANLKTDSSIKVQERKK
ncbi:hypothetical protein GCM10010919_03660 [Alishewanella longhuensis]|uniref:SH3b domain-containing protein n=1 Tax=Alishewanella longhuensis TaxID=1091037 RepID=A0ABQ3KUR8_9ALTE|nr:SH3 domain-containing protein [Alishewanella longhuensis]GHG60297.1 hypothetical protein GCM10010919_03660 [Alishewanella longhuensis]